LAAIVASSDDAIFSRAPDGIICCWNAGAERMFGYGAEEIVGQPVKLLIPEHRRGEGRLFGEVSAGELVDHYETEGLRKDGSQVWVSLTVSPVHDQAGSIVGASTIARDITERKRVEDELAEAQATLVRRERLSAVGEMATVIGHELRNPLGAVINLLFLARNRLTDHDDPELDGYLDRIERETNRAAALSDDLIAYMQEHDPVIVPLDFGAVVAEVLELTPPPPGIEVSVEGLGVDLQADRGQLVQILTKLITNAYQAMPDGGPLRVTGSKSDGFVEITVEDSGVGIDPAVAERLLEPFFTTKPTGTGLGLAIVKRFTEGHNGTVSIENGPTGGARVTIRLPHATAGVTR
jgi:PAS domain S-box-containing protein